MYLVGMTWTLFRWGSKLIGRPLRNHLVVEWSLWAFVFVQADVIVDWARLRAELMAQPPWVAGAALGALALLHAWSHRALVGDLLLGPALAVLRRQPAPDGAFGVPVALFLAVVGAPVGVAALVWYGGLRLDAAVWWGGLAALPILLVGGRRYGAGALAAVGAGALAAVGQLVPDLVGLLGGLIWAAQAPLLGRLAVRLAQEGSGRARTLGLQPRRVLGALVRRDLLALARAEQGLLISVAVFAGLLGLVVFAVRVNNDLAGLPLVRAALIGLALAGPIALQGVGAASRRLGAKFDPPQRPVASRLRSAGLAGTAALLLAPSWAAAAVGGAGGLGLLEHLRVALLVGALAAGVAWFVAIRPRKPDLAIYPWWAALCLGFALVGPWWGPLATLGLGALALGLATQRLERRRSAR